MIQEQDIVVFQGRGDERLALGQSISHPDCEKMPGDLDLKLVQSIGTSAFLGAEKITSVEFANLWNFAFSEFSNCIGLTNAVIDGVGLEFGGSGTISFFRGCTNLQKVVFGPGVRLGERTSGMLSGDNASIFSTRAKKLTEVVFQYPEPMDVSYACFENLEELRRVSFAGGVRSVKARAFNGCKKLEAVEGAFAPVDIGEYAFQQCGWLENTVNFDLSQCTNIGNQAFNSCTNFGGAVRLSALETIGYNAFQSCKSLERVEDMGTVTNINFGVFASCDKLTEVTFPETLEELDGSALQYSPSLAKITFLGAPPTVDGTTQGKKLWLSCTNRVEVAYPEAHAAGWATAIEGSLIRNSGSGGVLAYVEVPTPVPPDAGFADFVRIKMGNAGMTDEECQAKLEEVGANGYTWYASYVAGLEPENPESKFTATISFDGNGEPVVDFEPKTQNRVYRKFGKANLDDPDWTEVTDGNVSGYRFFKVTVELP